MTTRTYTVTVSITEDNQTPEIYHIAIRYNSFSGRSPSGADFDETQYIVQSVSTGNTVLYDEDERDNDYGTYVIIEESLTEAIEAALREVL